jgi:hypothetical protein
MVCLLIPVAAVLMGLALIGLATAPRISPGDICGHCRYSLRGLPDRGVCPECGNDFNRRTWSYLVPVWGSPAEQWALYLVPLGFGLLCGLACILFSRLQADPLFLVLGLGSGLLPVLPAVILVPLSSGRATREMTWTICIASCLIGPPVAVWAFVGSSHALATNAFASVGALFAPIAGATISCAIGGFFACIAALQQHRRATNARERAQTQE